MRSLSKSPILCLDRQTALSVGLTGLLNYRTVTLSAGMLPDNIPLDYKTIPKGVIQFAGLKNRRLYHHHRRLPDCWYDKFIALIALKICGYWFSILCRQLHRHGCRILVRFIFDKILVLIKCFNRWLSIGNVEYLAFSITWFTFRFSFWRIGLKDFM